MLNAVYELIDLGWYVYPLHEILSDGTCSCQEYQRSETNKQRLERMDQGERYDPDFVCERPGKHPRAQRGFHDATIDKFTAALWWGQWPNSGVGVNCGLSGLAVIDADSYKDPKMAEAIEYYLGDISTTVTNETGGGGYHFIFKMPEGKNYTSSQVVLSFGDEPNTVYLEFKGKHGTFNAAPSAHPSGTPYKWARSPFDYDILDLDDCPRIIDALNGAEARREQAIAERAVVNPGDFDDSHDYELARQALTFIDPMPGYAKWRDMVFAVHNKWPDSSGVALIEEWSPGYRGEVARMFSTCSTSGGITIGTLFEEAKKNGFAFPDRPKRTRNAPRNDKTGGRKSVKPAPKVAASPPKSSARTKPTQEDQSEYDDADTLGDLGVDEVSQDLGYPPFVETMPYTVNNGKLSFVKMKADEIDIQAIANFACRIVRQIDYEDGRRSYVVRGAPVRGRPFEFTIDAIEFGKRNSIAAIADAAAGALSAVVPAMSGHVGAAIKAVSTDVDHSLLMQRTGWSSDLETYYIDGRGLPEVEFEMLNQMESYKLDAERNIDDGLIALDHLIKALPESESRTTVILTAMLSAPLSQLVNARRYSIFLRGRSGTYKTSFCQAAMCLFGDFADENSIIKAGSGATHNAMMDMIASAADAPIFLDNFKPNTQQPGQFAALIHAATEGREKNRLSQNSTQRVARTLRSWLLMTGEDIPDEDAATMARLLAIPLPARKRSELPDLDYVQAHALDLNAVGLAWIEWLEGEGRAIAETTWKDFNQYRVKWAQIVRRQRDDVLNAGRIASNLATNEIVFDIICQHPTIGPVFKPYQELHSQGLMDLAGYMAAETTESMEAVQLLNYINAMITDGTATLLPAHGESSSHDMERMIGYRKGDKVLLHMTNVLRKVKQAFGRDSLNGVKATMLYAQIDSLDITPDGESAKPKSVSINGRTQYLLVLDADRFDNYNSRGESEDREFKDILEEIGA